MTLYMKRQTSWKGSKLNECLNRSSLPKGFLKKVLSDISQNSQENCDGILFLIKLNSVILHKKRRFIFK